MGWTAPRTGIDVPRWSSLQTSVEWSAVHGQVYRQFGFRHAHWVITQPDFERWDFDSWRRGRRLFQAMVARMTSKGLAPLSRAVTRRRKPSKAAGGRLERAARAYEELRNSTTVEPLPELPSP
jgi:hypothetical protein